MSFFHFDCCVKFFKPDEDDIGGILDDNIAPLVRFEIFALQGNQFDSRRFEYGEGVAQNFGGVVFDFVFFIVAGFDAFYSSACFDVQNEIISFLGLKIVGNANNKNVDGKSREREEDCEQKKRGFHSFIITENWDRMSVSRLIFFPFS